MRTTCIITDNSAQFPQISFPGRDRVRVISLDVEYRHQLLPEGGNLKVSDLDPVATPETAPRLVPPSVETFQELYTSLGRIYDNILVILMSGQLSGAYENAQEAAEHLQGARPIQVINSQTTSIGLGILVQVAAEAIEQGMSVTDTERLIRQMIPHIYTLVCTPSLSYLHYSGFADHAQAAVGEMLGIYPIFTLEEGRLTPLDKVRGYRYALDYYQEFIEEFDNLRHIALLQGSPSVSPETKMLRQFAQECFPNTKYTEHTMNLPFALLFGPRALSLMVVEDPDEDAS